MSNFEYAKRKAQIKAQCDYAKGLNQDAASHGACEGSAFETWYNEEYQRIEEEKFQKAIGEIKNSPKK